MAKAPADTIKYNVYADINVDGVVERADVVGAIFGQSEGLLGEDLELRDLQKTGRLGRIEVELESKSGKSSGTIVVPSSLDMVETSIIAAAVESVDRVGPCNAKIEIENIEDARASKRKKVIDRAKKLLKRMMNEEIPESGKMFEEVKKSVQLSEIGKYKGLPAGPSVGKADSVILVEGRADVLNLLRAGIKNVVAVGGTDVPKKIGKLSKKKTAIAFLDGDRGGEMILKELNQVGDVDFVAKTPQGKEVEELDKKEVIMALRKKIPLSQAEDYKEIYKEEQEKEESEELLKFLDEVKGELKAKLLDEKQEEITEVKIKDLVDALKEVQPYCIVMDGIVTQRLVDRGAKSKVKYIVGVSKSNISDNKGVKILTESS